MTDNESSRPPDCFLADFFGPLDDTHLVRRKEDLLRRAALVTAAGWNQFRYQWSTGEVLGTAVILHDRAELLRHGETVDSVLSRWAFDLWGIGGGQNDVDAGCPATRTWFDTASAELPPPPTTPTKAR